LLLYKSSWHHTSSHYNRTDFYSFDEDKYNELTQEDIDNISPSVTVKETPIRHKGEIDYIEWTGSYIAP